MEIGSQEGGQQHQQDAESIDPQVVGDRVPTNGDPWNIGNQLQIRIG